MFVASMVTEYLLERRVQIPGRTSSQLRTYDLTTFAVPLIFTANIHNVSSMSGV